MVRIKIDNEERPLNEAPDWWIDDQIKRRRRENKKVCIKVIFEQGELSFLIPTHGCPRTGRSRGTLSEQEKEIFERWVALGLDKPEFEVGQLFTFLKSWR